jgi:protein-S-isoprenylcysteine O-methyltransferase Ste14
MIIFWIVWAVWFSSEVLLNRLMRSGSNDKKGLDKGSIRLIWVMISIAITLGVVLAIYVRLPISKTIVLPFVGLTLIIIGMVFRFISIRALGRLFTVDVTIRDNHKIKKDGIYRIIRHPSYSGSLISFIGFSISLNNWLGLLAITIIITIALLYRIKIEEKILIDRFGTEYLDYKNNSYCLIPFIY